MDLLANEWDLEELTEWGMDLNFAKQEEINIDDFFEDLENSKPKDNSERIIITIPEELIENIEDIKKNIELTLCDYPKIKIT